MSAYLDKSQGVTFVYSNIYQLYLKAKHAKLDEPFKIERPAKSKLVDVSDSIKQSQVKEFKPRSFEVPMGVKEAEAKALKQNMGSMEGLKKNLENLKDALELC
jgi:hypothetical protein